MTIVDIAWASIGAILQIIVIGFAYVIALPIELKGIAV